jgi:hypothetical protein
MGTLLLISFVGIIPVGVKLRMNLLFVKALFPYYQKKTCSLFTYATTSCSAYGAAAHSANFFGRKHQQFY